MMTHLSRCVIIPRSGSALNREQRPAHHGELRVPSRRPAQTTSWDYTIRHLAGAAMPRLGELAPRVSMSPRAGLRHLGKLERRGYLRRTLAGRRGPDAFAQSQGPLRRALLRAVREHLMSTEE